jgi:hypothetical protein
LKLKDKSRFYLRLATQQNFSLGSRHEKARPIGSRAIWEEVGTRRVRCCLPQPATADKRASQVRRWIKASAHANDSLT